MFDSILGQSLTLPTFLICTGVSLALGVVLALASSFRARTSQSFGLTLAVLPAVVQLVIMLVNGNLGAGVAGAGAFSLVRFRSIPGTARDRAPCCFSPWPSALPPAWAISASPSWPACC